MVYEKVSSDMNFVEREKEVEKFGKKTMYLKKALKIVSRVRPTHFMTVLRLPMANRISGMYLQELLRI